MRFVAVFLSLFLVASASAQTTHSYSALQNSPASYDYAAACFAAATLSKFYADQGVVPIGSDANMAATLYNAYLDQFRPILNQRARSAGKSDQAVQADIRTAMSNWDSVRNYTNASGQATTGQLAGYFARLEYLLVCNHRLR